MARRIATREQVGTVMSIGSTARVTQRGEGNSRKVAVEYPALIQVLEGTKTIRRNGREWTIAPGEVVALAGGQAFDVANRPGPGGRFEARWLVFDQDGLEEWFGENPQLPVVTDALRIPLVEPDFARLIDAACDAIEMPERHPLLVGKARVREVLAWIGVHGGRLPPVIQASLATRIRGLVSAKPAFAWTAVEVSSLLGMSEATLRRRLSREGQSFSALLSDIRMNSAFTLLVATDFSIESIAASVGYGSPSRFAEKFRDRFGHLPSGLRGRRGPAEGTIILS